VSEVERLLAQYKEAHRAGGAVPDPRPYLDGLERLDREELIALIDAYLERAPRQAFHAEAFRDSPAAPVAEGLQRALAGSSGLWPAVLPRLRAQARMRRAELVAELAARLGAQSQQGKVASYYHEMEQGLLPADGVSDTVLEALGKIVGWSAGALRRAGELPAPGGPGGPGDAGAVFARARRREGGDAPEQRAPSGDADWDEVDRLFRGG
jgi:hypothetical protein